MRYKLLCVLLFGVGLCHLVHSQRWQERKSQATDEAEENEDEGTDLDAIKIVAPPDLSNDKPTKIKDSNENGKSEEDDDTDNLDVKYKLAANWLKRFSMQIGGNFPLPLPDDTSELEEFDSEEIAETLKNLPEFPQTPPRDPTPEEIEAEETYNLGMKLLNASRPDRRRAFVHIQEAANMGHRDARIQVAWAHLFGSILPQNIEKAKEIFEELAEEGAADAHMGLGFLYAAGIGVNASQPLALIHYIFGAVGGSHWARMALGYRYFTGVTLANSCERSLMFYRKVANKVADEVTFTGGTAIHRARLLEEMENQNYNSGMMGSDMLDYYELLASNGDVQTLTGLGQLHYQGGRGIEKDLTKAAEYFSKAAENGNAAAIGFLGMIYLQGSDEIKQDYKQAFVYLKKAADLNDPVGLSGLGLLYLHGKGVPRDYKKAFQYFSLAAEQGWVDGQLQLGNMYFSGIGTRRDYTMANKFFALASQSGHVLAYYNLAQMHASGIGVLRSCNMAVELYKNVAERGKWGERLMEAHRHYREGRTDEAFVMYALLAELGYEVAQSNAGFILDRGEVTLIKNSTEMYTRALMYWRRAAAQGYSAAEVKLGDYHYYGMGTVVDYEMAATHYSQASEHQHNAQAMFNLGYMHEQGLGMQQDIHLAKRFYDLAADASTDAKIPVALALLKLSVLFGMKYIQESHWHEWLLLFNLNRLLGPNWDIYLITALVGLLGIVGYLRRPQPR